MQPLAFDIDTRAGISHEISRMMGLDGQDAHRTERDKVVCIDLRHVDEGDRETVIGEYKNDELNGPNSGLDSIVRMIESTTLRDALTRYGNVVYAIYFHLSGGQNNRGRHPFVIPGGAHTIRGGAGAPGNGLTRRGGGNEYGALDSPMAADALKVSVEFLKWSTEERKVNNEERRINDDRAAALFRTMETVIKTQADIIDDGLKRELRVRELETGLLDHKYELEKKRKADEVGERWKEIAIDQAVTYAPMLLPPVVEMIRKFNGGPNYVPQEMNIESIQETIRKAKEVAAGASGEGGENGHGHAPQTQAGHNGNGNGNGNGPPPTTTASAPQEDPTPIEIWHHRIAFDLTRLVALVKASGHLQQMRDALAGSELAQKLLDQIVEATNKPTTGSEESITELTQLALGFGSTLMQTPMVGMQLVQSLQGFERAAVIELSDLLQRYVKFVEEVAAAQQTQQQQRQQQGAQQGAQR